jgi:chromosomal replication initiation ATPase DnaA
LENASQTRELEIFLRNLQIGLKKYSLSELNESIEAIVTDKNEKFRQRQVKVDLVVNVICKHFGLDRDIFLNGRGKGTIQQARKYAYCILHNDYDLPIRYISHQVFSLKWHTSVSVAIQYAKTLNEDVKPDKEFIQKLKELRNEINIKIKNTTI